MNKLWPYLFVALGSFFVICNASQAEETEHVTHLSPEKFEQSDLSLVWLADNWLYHPGDNPAWADSSYDDSNWEPVHPSLNLRVKYPKDGWQGNGWFRLHLKVDSTLLDQPLGMRVRHFGASEIYLDGKELFRFGTVGHNVREESRFFPQYPRTVIFSGKKDHVIAVRYSYHGGSKYLRKLGGLGFSMNIGYMDDAIAVKMVWSVRYKSYMLVIMVSSLLLALFHIILFSYNTRQKLNLYLSLLSVSFAAFALFNFQNHFTSNPGLFLLFTQMKILTSVMLVILQLLTIYTLFYPKPPKLFYFFGAGGFVIILLLLFRNNQLFILGDGFMILGFAETARVGLMKGWNRKGGYRIIVAGLVILFISIAYQMLIGFHIVKPIGGLFLPYIYGFLAFLVSMSVFLAMQFAQTSRDLQQQLHQVRELSEKMLEQERIAKDQEITRRLLEADNHRKTEELEEARKLQLSLLPKEVPQVPGMEIAAFMKTATEVGGDYYDFCIGPDSTLTVALGDATGHGMKAGLIVALIKSLFLAEAPFLAAISFLEKCSQTIKKMQLGNLYMAMTLLKIKDSEITVSAAGMPPALIYRNKEGRVEEVMIKGLPLGGPGDTTYRELSRKIAPGDTLLLMSDGFPELFNNEMEMLDYSKAKSVFGEVAHKSPQDILTHLNAAAEQWLNGKPQDDDITFVVVKFNK